MIHDFAFTFAIGIIIGSYSSIFVASAFVIYFTKYRQKRELQQKMGGGSAKKKIVVRPEPKFQS